MNTGVGVEERQGERGRTPQRGIGGLVRSGPFRRLLIAQAISGLGDWVATFAFMAAAFALTESPFGVGLILVLRLAPPVFAAPLGGLVADRFDRRRVMVAADVGRGALIVMAPFVGTIPLYLIAFSHEMLTMLYLPARDATVPELAPREELPTANGLVMGSSMGSLPLAAALFAGLRAATDRLPEGFPFAELLAENPTSLAFFFDAATFIVSVPLILSLPLQRRDGEDRQMKPWQGIVEGLRFVAGHHSLRSLGYGLIVSMFGGGVLFAIGIPYVRGTLGGSDTLFGWLAALWGVGMALGLMVARLPLGRRKASLFMVGVTVSGLSLVVMGLFALETLALGMSVVFGVGFSSSIMLAMALAQRSADDRIRGRIMGGVQMLFRAGLAAGAMGMGALAHAVGSLDLLIVSLDGNQVGLVAGGLLIVLGAVAAAGVRQAPEWEEV